MTRKKLFPLLMIACIALLASAAIILPRLNNRSVSNHTVQTFTESDVPVNVPEGAEPTKSPAALARGTDLRPLEPNLRQSERAATKNAEGKRDAEPDESNNELILRRNGKEIRIKQKRTRKPGERFDKPAEAMRWYLQKRLPEGEKELPVDRYFTALDQIRNMPQFSTASGQMMPSQAEAAKNTANMPELQPFIWEDLGPGNVGGRTRGLVIDPTNPNIMYSGGVAGGIWKSIDAGASWSPLDDFMANIAVNSLAMDPDNSSILYAGTGEGFFNADAVRGAGIFKTTNGGTTWTRLAATNTSDFFFVQKVVVSPANSQHVYAATRTGVHRSLDGGTTWTLVLVSNAANGDSGAMDIVMRSDATGQASDYIYAALGTFAQSHIWRNIDAGGAGVWTDVLAEPDGARTTLAIAPSNQNTIYALISSNVAGPGGGYLNGLLAVKRSTSSGDSGTWTTRVLNTDPKKQNTLLLTNPVFAALTECGFGTTQILNQGWYDNILAVDPADENIVWAGGIDLFRSDDGGANWGVASYWWFSNDGVPPGSNPDAEYNHADQHAIIFHPQYNGTTNRIMYTGNDGGIFRTDDARANVGFQAGATIVGTDPICGNTVNGAVAWTALNNSYQISQFYHGLPYPNGTTYFGGFQDNGTNRGTDAAGPNQWERIFGGDGGYVAVDPTNTNILYIETTGLSLSKSTDGGANFAPSVSGISGDVFPFITVFQMDPSNSQRIWIGGRSMWRTDNAAGVWTLTSQAITAGSIRAIAIAPTNPDLVLAGTASGRVARTTVGTTATSSTVWTFIDTPRGLNNGTISWITFDPTNANIAYLTISTFNGTANGAGTNAGHIFKSINGGQTWTLSDGTGQNTIPDIPAHSIVVVPNNPQRLYAGTDLGVFVSLDGGANWFKESGFPNVATEVVAVNTVGLETSVFAFTHGRSAFRVGITPTAAPASISGSVTTAVGTPLAGVVISLQGGSAESTITDSNGQYQFDGVEAGSFYTVTPSLANYRFSPANRYFSLVGNQTDAVFTGAPEAIVIANAIDTTEYFVRQHYLDFLGREPDQGGFEYWSAQINQCGSDAACIRSKRTGVSAAFFIEAEFQQTGSFIYRLYQSALGRQLSYREFVSDRGQLRIGPDLEANKAALADAFVQRPEFARAYQSTTTAALFVDALLRNVEQSTGLDLSGDRNGLIARYETGAGINQSRSLVVKDVAESAALSRAVYNKAFVLMQYFGYLQRDPDQSGYDFWLDVVSNRDVANYRSMVCAFISSAEYQRRFGSLVTRTDADCGR